jgi:hypothetical protein
MGRHIQVSARFELLGYVRAQLGANCLESIHERGGQAREAGRCGSNDQRDEHDVFNKSLTGLVIVEQLKPLNQGFHDFDLL